MKKKLYRNSKDGMFGGVVLGFAEYFGGDVTLWRIGFVLSLFLTGFFPLALAYVVALFIMPDRPGSDSSRSASYVVYD